MQAHPECPDQGFQYRENTVSLFPTPCYFSPLYRIQKPACWEFMVMNGIHEKKKIHEKMNPGYRQGTMFVQEIKNLETTLST